MDCPSPERLQGLRDPTLGADERDALTAHAEGCDACRATIVALFAGATVDGGTVSSVPDVPGSDALVDGERLDRYVIEGRLGAGAMGVVYAARDPELDRPVAIKVLKSKTGGQALRLQREAQALARVSHPNVVAVHDVGTHHGDVWIAMQLVHGETLRGWVARGQSVAAILARLREAGRGLAAVHAAGLVHRDFKPDNVLVDDERARITDFGLARLDDDQEPDGTARAGSPLSLTLTQTGTLLGTPVYSAPEQLVDARVDARADQFAFCATAYEALYGVRPFAGDTIHALVENARRQAFVPPKTTAIVPPHIDRAIRQGLAGDPAARHASLDALLHELEPRAKRRVPLAVIVAVPVIVAGVTVFAVAARRHDDGCDGRGELAGVWDASVAKRARLVGASRTALDRYADQWIRARDAACHATPPAPARAACLDDARDRLAAVTRYTVAHDTTAAVLATLVAQNLPAVASCETARGFPPAPPAPAIAADVARARSAIVDAEIALSLATMPEVAATTPDYPPLRAERAFLDGELAHGRGDPFAAVGFLREAIALAESCGHDRLKARAASRLARLLVTMGRRDEAATMIDLAAATTARTGESATTDLAHTRARLADLRGASEDAVAAYREAIANGTDEVATAHARYELHALLVRLGRADEALLAAAAATLRPLGHRCGDDPNLLGAEQACRIEAIEIERAQGPRSPALAAALQSFALVEQRLADWPSAHRLFERAATILDAGGQTAAAAVAYERAGQMCLELADAACAVPLLERSVAGDPRLVSAAAALGRAYAESGKAADAIRVLEPALPALPAREIPPGRLAFADALWRRDAPGDRDRAREQARLARDAAAAQGPADAIERRRMTQLIARIDAWIARH